MDTDDARWDAAAALHERATDLLAAGDVAGAHDAAIEAVAALEAVLGPDHPDVGNAIDTLAGTCERLGRPAEALAHWRRAVAILSGWPGEDVVTAMRVPVLCNLADALMRQGAYAEAAALAEQAAADAAEVHGEGTAAAADVDVLRGVLARFQGRWDEALRFYRRARRAYEAAGVPVPASLLHNFAGLAAAQGHAAEARRYAEAAVAARRENEPGNALGLATDLAGLGDALQGLGEGAAAVAAYREALRIMEADGFAGHPEAAYATHNLADALADGDPAEAERLYRVAIARKTELFGPDHHEVAGSLNNLAALYADAGRLDEARAASAQAVAIVRRLAPDHPIRVGCEAFARSLAGR